jgi:hypothetical protein
MHTASLLAACLLSIALAGCAIDAGQRVPSETGSTPVQPTAPRSDGAHAPAPGPVAPLQQQPAPARIPYQLILPPPLPAPVPAPAPAGPQAPLPLTTCDPGGCWDAGGSRYNGGIGNNLLDRSGRLCQRNGAWTQCF